MGKSILDRVQLSQYDPEPGFLNNSIGELLPSDTSEADANLEKTIAAAMQDSVAIPKPLTADEARAVDRKVQELRGRIAKNREAIRGVKASIDDYLSRTEYGGVQVSVESKGVLKRAMKAIFGEKSDTITYAQYKACVDAKLEIEMDQGTRYAKGTL